MLTPVLHLPLVDQALAISSTAAEVEVEVDNNKVQISLNPSLALSDEAEGVKLDQVNLNT